MAECTSKYTPWDDTLTAQPQFPDGMAVLCLKNLTFYWTPYMTRHTRISIRIALRIFPLKNIHLFPHKSYDQCAGSVVCPDFGLRSPSSIFHMQDAIKTLSMVHFVWPCYSSQFSIFIFFCGGLHATKSIHRTCCLGDGQNECTSPKSKSQATETQPCFSFRPCLHKFTQLSWLFVFALAVDLQA